MNVFVSKTDKPEDPCSPKNGGHVFVEYGRDPVPGHWAIKGKCNECGLPASWSEPRKELK